MLSSEHSQNNTFSDSVLKIATKSLSFVNRCFMVQISWQVYIPCVSHLSINKKRQKSWLFAFLTSQQHASATFGRICSDDFRCCHTETEAADQTFYLIQSQYTGTRPTSPSTDPIMPDSWQGSNWSANICSHWYDLTLKNAHGTSRNQTLDLLLLQQMP